MKGAASALRAPLALLVLAAAPMLASCGGKLPEVAAVEWRLETRPDEHGARYESLSVFGSIKDEDGIDNIAEIWIVQDDSAFAWMLSSADWIKGQDGSDDWIGGSSLATPEFGPLPRGGYRFIAVDAAGQKAELRFSVAATAPDKPAPSLSYSAADGRLSVQSDWTETLVLAFDSAGILLGSVAAPASQSSLAELFGSDKADRAALIGAYGYEPELKVGAFSTRTKTR